MDTIALPPFRTTVSWFRTKGAFWPSQTYRCQHSLAERSSWESSARTSTMQVVPVGRLTVEERKRDPDELVTASLRVDPDEPLSIAVEKDLLRGQAGQPEDVADRDEPVGCRLARFHLEAAQPVHRAITLAGLVQCSERISRPRSTTTRPDTRSPGGDLTRASADPATGKRVRHP